MANTAEPDFYLAYKTLGHHMIDPCIEIEGQDKVHEFKKIFENGIADGENVVLTTNSTRALQFEENCPHCKTIEIK